MSEEITIEEAFKQCFLQYQKICFAYNELLKENRKLKCENSSSMEDKIRELAYLKWEKAGYPQGNGVEYWLQAEEEMLCSTKNNQPERQKLYS